MYEKNFEIKNITSFVWPKTGRVGKNNIVNEKKENGAFDNKFSASYLSNIVNVGLLLKAMQEGRCHCGGKLILLCGGGLKYLSVAPSK